MVEILGIADDSCIISVGFASATMGLMAPLKDLCGHVILVNLWWNSHETLRNLLLALEYSVGVKYEVRD